MQNRNPYLQHWGSERQRRRKTISLIHQSRAEVDQQLSEPLEPQAPQPKHTELTTINNTKNSQHKGNLYGNYDHYYTRRQNAHSLDQRLTILDPELFKGKRVLDIGCNVGFVTIGIASLFDPLYVEGVDIDPDLIRKADKKSILMDDAVAESDDLVLSDVFDYFPKSATHVYGLIPKLFCKSSKTETGATSLPPVKFPYNMKFRCSEWVHEPLPTSGPRFDVVLALSVTKWIHLNWGDPGIKLFFRKVYQSLSNHGVFIVEPQPWHTYERRTRNSPKILQNFSEIKLRPDSFMTYLVDEVGFKSVRKIDNNVDAQQKNGFGRDVFLLHK
ncbi:Bicoid-interacting protein 3-domain-containing protein [Cladochytrium replicatum]|nr:Bicoid-interacting protein 3-domain-containing protein [Cladochytrium replicatum]